tara:strand:+ start:309 stop:749 length:441 start_codon:yes stop_codon:yes gene_type:complete
MDLFRDLYQQLIIDHNQNPRNFRIIEKPTYCAEGQNPLCGDQLSIFIIESEGKIEDISFIGEGCAISKASASIMTTTLKGLSIKEGKSLFEKFHTLVTTGNSLGGLGKLEVLGGVHKYPSRVKCASLSWHTFNGAVNKIEDIIKTE